jgi:hypothetical protein
MPNSVRVDSLRIHPLKSGAIRTLERSDVTPAGLVGDRRWMVVDEAGECVTARSDRALFTLTAEPLPNNGLRLTSRSGKSVEVCRPLTSPSDSPARSVTVHGRDAAPGLPLDERAQTLIREVLGRDDVTILWCSDETVRRLNPDFSREGDSTAYADGYPVTSRAWQRCANSTGSAGGICRSIAFAPTSSSTATRALCRGHGPRADRRRRLPRGSRRRSVLDDPPDPATLTTGAEPIRPSPSTASGRQDVVLHAPDPRGQRSDRGG